jgi:hypothetical protein
MHPAYWAEFLKQHSLIGRSASVSESDDASGVGADLIFLDTEGTRVELDELYPGIVVKHDGFVPVGGCDIGTGDQYFINVNDGIGGPLYRIDHEAVSSEGYDRASAVEVVLRDYREILTYLEPVT